MNGLQLQRPIAWIDLETTGTDTRKDRIVEISIVVFRPDAPDPQVRTRRINPGMPIPAEATEVHGITDDDVAGEPGFDRYAQSLLHFLDDCDLGGFNIRRFDLPMLVAEFERAGQRFDHRGRAIIDPLALYHKFNPRNLEAAVQQYLGREHDGAHGAEADAIAAAEVLTAQLATHDLPTDPAELHALIDETWKYETEVDRWWDTSDPNPKRWVFKRGKHKGELLGDSSVRSYLEWMAGKADDMHPDVAQVAQDMLFGRFQ